MDKKTSMRDAFWNEIYQIALKDRDVMIVTGDMGAPSIDQFRNNLPDQYLNVGIAEHSMVATAAGLAREGKKVFTYAIAPFITSRCHEFTKVDACLMKIPIKLVGCGAGFSYEDSGPTHHTTEDISIMRCLPGLEILSPSDSALSARFAHESYKSGSPAYIRLDREVMPLLYDKLDEKSLGKVVEKGYNEFPGTENKVAVFSTGNMVHKALEMQERFPQINVVDMNRIKPLDDSFISTLAKYRKIVSLEEHLLDGGLGSILSEIITDNNLGGFIQLKRVGLRNYVYAYGGRGAVREAAGIGTEKIAEEVKRAIGLVL